MNTVDILIRGGRVIDPYRNFDGIADIAIKNGVIVSSENVEAAQTVDASGCIVTPGLIDSHTHLAAYASDLGISGESVYFPTGVTTAVDAGSTGTANYEAFRQMTLTGKLRIKAYLNVCPAGLVTGAYHENLDPACYRRETMRRYLKKYSDQLLGLKLRSSKELVGEFGLEPLRTMLEIAEEAGCPVVVHTTNPPASPEVLARILGACIMIGIARSVALAMDSGQILDTVVYYIAQLLGKVPAILQAPMMFWAHTIINFFVTSGSGQANVTMPIFLPVADLIGMSSETAVLALNYGDGLSNYIYPHSSSLMAFLAACGVGYGTWMKFMGKLFGLWFTFASLFMMLAVVVGYH